MTVGPQPSGKPTPSPTCSGSSPNTATPRSCRRTCPPSRSPCRRPTWRTGPPPDASPSAESPPPPPYDGCAATPTSSPSCSTEPDARSTSDTASDQYHPGSAEPCKSEIAGAPTPDATDHPAGPNATTSSNGSAVDRP